MNPTQCGHRIIVIGASMGGIEAIGELLSSFKADFTAVFFVVMHLHPNSPSVLNRMLQAQTELHVKFAEDGAVPNAGTVYIAPPDHHLLLEKERMVLSRGPRENRFRPAIDPLFRSAAVAHTTKVIGVLLTGLLDDGVAGLQAIKDCGGMVVVQDPDDAAFPEMPRNAVEKIQVDHCLALQNMGKLLKELVALPVNAPKPIPERLQKEVRIAKGIIDPDIEQNIIAPLVPLVCPDCGGALSEITDGKILRYRCHEGHGYTVLSLLNAQWERVEYSLWAAVRVMEEQANMLRKMSKSESLVNTSYQERASELQVHASRLKDYLLYSMKTTV